MSDLQNFREALASHRAELLSSLGVRYDGLSSQGRVSEEDQANVTHEEFISMARNRIEHEKLKQLNLALQRLQDGDYGTCQECGEEIAPKRLKAIPWARFCIHCQDAVSSRQPEETEVSSAQGARAD